MTAVLSELQAAYRAGMMTKEQFIAEAHVRHHQLFDYPNQIGASDLERVVISADGVEFFSKWGVRFACDPSDSRAAPIESLNFGHYEGIDADLFFRLIQPHDTVLDVGAHIGWYALHVASRFASSKVIAVEPVPTSNTLLRQNVQRNQLENVTVCDFALANTTNDTTLYVPVGLPTAASSANILGYGQSITVATRRMDDVVAELDLTPQVIKIDVEGSEYAVLEGGKSTLQRFRPIVYCEMLRKWSAAHGRHPNDTIQFMAEFGYVCGFAGKYGLTIIDCVTDETVATNFVFAQQQEFDRLLTS